MGVAVAHFDNTGHPDLCVVGVTKNHFLHINGDGTFIHVTHKARVGGGMYDGKKLWSATAAWTVNIPAISAK